MVTQRSQKDTARKEAENQILKNCNQLKGFTFLKSARVSFCGALKADSRGLLLQCLHYMWRKMGTGDAYCCDHMRSVWKSPAIVNIRG